MRRELRLKYNVPDDQLDEIIAIALELKAQEQDETIDDEETEAAAWRTTPPTITAIDLERAATIQGDRLAVHRDKQGRSADRKAAARSLGRIALWGVFLAICAGAIGTVAAISLAIGPVADAKAKTERLESRLNALILTQAEYAGRIQQQGGPESLKTLSDALLQARPGPERLRASDALWVAMAQGLGDMQVPRTYPDIEAQAGIEQGLAESHALFAPERERYEELLDIWEAVADNDRVRWAIELGLTEAPPR